MIANADEKTIVPDLTFALIRIWGQCRIRGRTLVIVTGQIYDHFDLVKDLLIVVFIKINDNDIACIIFKINDMRSPGGRELTGHGAL